MSLIHALIAIVVECTNTTEETQRIENFSIRGERRMSALERRLEMIRT